MRKPLYSIELADEILLWAGNCLSLTLCERGQCPAKQTLARPAANGSFPPLVPICACCSIGQTDLLFAQRQGLLSGPAVRKSLSSYGQCLSKQLMPPNLTERHRQTDSLSLSASPPPRVRLALLSHACSQTRSTALQRTHMSRVD